jgi:hypothetical protein
MTRLDEVRAMTREQLMEALASAETSADHHRLKRREAEGERDMLREALEYFVKAHAEGRAEPLFIARDNAVKVLKALGPGKGKR